MQNYQVIPITAADVVPTAERMRAAGRMLIMIHGYIDKDGNKLVSYEYATDQGIASYAVSGADVLPTISTIYSAAAEWPERELNELIGVEFTGLDTSSRLFLPDNLLEGDGHILVMPLEELREKNIKAKEE
ncbi:MAG: NADH-quinone oxidoreductase subunit C [Bacillota bacterium]|nr:NADH-quinone oxidoreductase subunit C [Bacillota bacterium]